MRNFLAIVAIGLFLVLPHAATPGSAPLPQIWFSIGGQGKPETYQSWDTLFYQPDAPWPEFMNHVTAVGILTQVLAQISDGNLAKVVAKLKQKHIALGVEMLAQAYDPPGCGGGVEGYFPTNQVTQLAAKLKRAGAEVAYIVMDEPLWFGHYFDGPHACHSSIENVADRVAENLNEYLKVFPNAIIGDGEPFPAITNQPAWRDDYRHWLAAFRTKTGRALAFTTVDINWGHTEWPQGLQAFVSFARDVHMPVGIIFNAAPPNKNMTNEEWLNDAQRNLVYIEKTLGLMPRWAVFASWVRFPGRAISVTDGLGEDYLVKQYLRLHGVQ
jgi:hypothetical protein